MLPRLWRFVRYGIAAKLYLLTVISIAALAVLATASIHFAGQTKFAAERLYSVGVAGIQTVSQLEVLFAQHRALITAAPAELDRRRLLNTRLAVEALNARIDARVQTEPLVRGRPEGKLLTEIAAQVPHLKGAGDFCGTEKHARWPSRSRQEIRPSARVDRRFHQGEPTAQPAHDDLLVRRDDARAGVAERLADRCGASGRPGGRENCR